MTPHRRFTLRHVFLLAVLVGAVLLVMSDQVIPRYARVPGLLLLAALALGLVVGAFRPRGRRGRGPVARRPVYPRR